jgi:phosphoglycolate phosphatase
VTVRLAVFDCDGTLVDGQASICGAMETAFAVAGLPAPERHQVRRIVGLSLPQAMAMLLPGSEQSTRDLAAAEYRAAYRAAREAGQLAEPLYDGIPALLGALRAEGWMLGVATGKSHRGLAHVLAMHGLTNHFTTLQTADRHPSKPHPAMLEAALAEAGCAPDDAVMIGDTAYDMAMAVSAGVRAIGVAWGYHDTAELTAAGAVAVAGSAAQLEDLLR